MRGRKGINYIPEEAVGMDGQIAEQVEAVQRMQDYIAAHLTENVTLAALAEAAG